MNIETRIESARGCGYRKQGGKYLMGGSFGRSCGKLPIPLDYCPCCGSGIKFARGFQWMSGEFLKGRTCKFSQGCTNCQPFAGCESGEIKKLGLLWVGEKFYPSPEDFMMEGAAMGLSKRISAIPKDLVLGETWVMLAHKKAIRLQVEKSELSDGVDAPEFGPGIFSMFQPTHLEYVVRERNGKVIDGKKKLKDLEKRGFKLVRVIPKLEEVKDDLI